MPPARNKQVHVAAALRAKSNISSLIRLTATQLAVAGLVGMSIPSIAADIPTSYRNEYRSCVGRLQSVGISAEAAASACAESVYPVNLSRCVARIERETKIAAEAALSTCRQVREPIDVATCVVGISRNDQEEPVPGVLTYCGRSLLPVNYAECVVGLRRELTIATPQALDTCISAASDRPGQFSPGLVPGSQLPLIKPAPPVPSVPGDATPLTEPSPLPNTPSNQLPPVQSAPAPTTP